MQRNRNKSNYDLFSNQYSIGVGLEEIYIFYPYKQYNLVFLKLNSLFFQQEKYDAKYAMCFKTSFTFWIVLPQEIFVIVKTFNDETVLSRRIWWYSMGSNHVDKKHLFYLLVHYSKICFMGHVYLIFCTCTLMNIV